MSDKTPVDDLIGGVPETMMVPLYARAAETQRPDAIISDPHAVAMLDRIDYDFTRFTETHSSNLGVAIRTEILDEWTAAYIKAHPTAQVINIAAGLDTRFSRVDNGQITWVDLDLPASIAVRNKLITPGPRERVIAQSVLDFTWVNALADPQKQTLFIIEGLLMYFTEDMVRELLTTLAARFPGATALIEVMGVSQARETRSDAVQQTAASFKWGIRHTADLATWDERITVVRDESIFDRHAGRWHALDLDWGRATEIAWPERLTVLRNTVDRIVELQFS